jgi:hypothetical protein
MKSIKPNNMKNLEQFKSENAEWLENLISDYVSEMEWEEGMDTHPSDYFTDTLSITREKCDNDELAFEVKNYIEEKIINSLK